MSAIFLDPEMDDATRREALYGGQLVVYSPRPRIAGAFHPHRDTWYSAPFNQINWWLPVYDIEPNNGMAFHLRCWDRAIRNGSSDYNCAEWSRVNRSTAAQHVNDLIESYDREPSALSVAAGPGRG